MSKCIEPAVEWGVNDVARLLNVSRRQVWRFYHEEDPDTGTRHPFGEMMWIDEATGRRKLLINRNEVMAYLADCRYGRQKRTFTEFIPVWGFSGIARGIHLPRTFIKTAFEAAVRKDPDGHPIGRMMWRDPHWGRVAINYIEVLRYFDETRQRDRRKRRRHA